MRDLPRIRSPVQIVEKIIGTPGIVVGGHEANTAAAVTVA